MFTFHISQEGESKNSRVKDKLRGAGKEKNSGSMNFRFGVPKLGPNSNYI